MHHERLDHWQHKHVFGQDRKRPGEIRTLIVVGLTLAMMVWEILAGIVYGSMALLADGLHMGSHAVALGAQRQRRRTSLFREMLSARDDEQSVAAG